MCSSASAQLVAALANTPGRFPTRTAYAVAGSGPSCESTHCRLKVSGKADAGMVPTNRVSLPLPLRRRRSPRARIAHGTRLRVVQPRAFPFWPCGTVGWNARCGTPTHHEDEGGSNGPDLEMSWEAQAWAVKQHPGGLRKAVLMALAYCANHEDGLCNPRIETLCEMTDFGRTAIKDALTALENEGYIARRRLRNEDGTWGNYHYSFPALGSRDDPGEVAYQGRETTPAPGPRDDPQELEVNLEPFTHVSKSQVEVVPLFVVEETSRRSCPPAKVRSTDELWDALAAALGDATADLTKSERGRRNAALKELRDVGATPDELRRRAKAYPRVMPPGTLLTASALVANWALLGNGGKAERDPKTSLYARNVEGTRLGVLSERDRRRTPDEH